jgi:NAD(P)-dependent dehydrogenase (short-subunit alcohol dehydrogenase family)
VFSILFDCELSQCRDLKKVVLTRWNSFAPLLQKKGTIEDPSRVIITASVAGIGVGTLGKNATFGYSASKAAVIHLTKNLAVELGPRHILVNAIAPGFFPSKMASELIKLTGGADALADANPSKRLGKPEDIAGLVVFLSSRASSHVNGATITVDGGEVWARGGMVNAMQDQAKL